MNIADAHDPKTQLPNPMEAATAVSKQLKELTIGQQISIVVAALSAGLLAGLVFIVSVDGFVVTLGQSLHLPLWLTVALAIPATLAGIAISIWMFRSTYIYERRAVRGEANNDTPEP